MLLQSIGVIRSCSLWNPCITWDSSREKKNELSMNDTSTFGARYSYAADISSFCSLLLSCSEYEADIKRYPDFF